MRKRILLILTILSLAIRARATQTIVLPENPTPSQKFAAEELTRYITQMGGSKDVIRVTTLRDAYQTLEDAGCRFLSPQFDFYNGSAEFVPKSFALKPTHHAEPVLKYRKLYVEEGHSHTVENLKQMIDWMPKAGYNVLVVPMNYQGRGQVMWDNWRDALTPELQKRDITIEVGGHGYQNFLNADMEDGKLFDEHPEWFGQDKTGQRRREKNFVFCTSNDDAVKYVTDHFLAYVKAHPEIQIFDFWPPDVGHWCECDACKKLGSPSDRQARLVNQLLAAKPSCRLEVLGYLTSITPPEHVKLDKSVLLDFCPIGQRFDLQMSDPSARENVDYVADLKSWRSAFDGDISIYSYYRKYAWNSLPILIPHYMQGELKFYASLPVQGVSTYSEPGDWGTYEINHYALAKLACDPNANVDELIKEFCDARYGAASDKAQIAIETLEESRKFNSIPYTPLPSIESLTNEIGRVERARSGVMDADVANTDLGVQGALNRLDLMLQYASRDLVLQQMRAGHDSDEAIQRQVHKLAEFLAPHANEGVFDVQDHRLGEEMLQKHYK